MVWTCESRRSPSHAGRSSPVAPVLPRTASGSSYTRALCVLRADRASSQTCSGAGNRWSGDWSVTSRRSRKRRGGSFSRLGSFGFFFSKKRSQFGPGNGDSPQFEVRGQCVLCCAALIAMQAMLCGRPMSGAVWGDTLSAVCSDEKLTGDVVLVVSLAFSRQRPQRP